MKTVRLNTINPAFNLASEEYLFKRATSGCPLCVIWQNRDSIIIGVNQNAYAETDIEKVKKDDVPIIRRKSGGGAVFHDLNNINWTLITDKDNAEKDKADFLQAILSFLKTKGINASLSGRNDICIGEKKISGTAQYCENGFILFHGTLLFKANSEKIQSLLTPDKAKLVSKGISSVKSRTDGICSYLNTPISILEFRNELCAYLSNGDEIIQLDSSDYSRIFDIVNNTYGNDEWTFGRAPAYEFNKNGHFPYGNVSVSLNIKDGLIINACFTGDFFSQKPVTEIESALSGIIHSPENIAKFADTVSPSDYITGMTKTDFINLMT